jgi:hypothetical protein
MSWSMARACLGILLLLAALLLSLVRAAKKTAGTEAAAATKPATKPATAVTSLVETESLVRPDGTWSARSRLKGGEWRTDAANLPSKEVADMAGKMLEESMRAVLEGKQGVGR